MAIGWPNALYSSTHEFQEKRQGANKNQANENNARK